MNKPERTNKRDPDRSAQSQRNEKDTARPLPKSDSAPAAPLGEEYLRVVLNSAHDFGIITLDTKGYVITWNTGAEKLFGWHAEEMIGNTVEAIFTPEDRENRVPQQARRIALETGSCAEERWFQRKNGTRFFSSGKLSPIRDKSGQHIGFVKISRDLTEASNSRQSLKGVRNGIESSLNFLLR